MIEPSPPPILQKRAIPSLGDFLKNISPKNPTGASLRYDPIYDEIRLARKEDDPRLSMGIWKTDLKRADWYQVETLCIEALTTQSKDLQIAAWLTEAWTSLDDVEGYMRGIRLISDLIGAFWETIHPKLPEDGDVEGRLMVFEWMDRAFAARLLHTPLTRSKLDQTSFGLGFFKSAQYNDTKQKQTEKTTRNASSHNDPSKAVGTMEEFQRSLEQTTEDYLSKQQQNIAKALQTTQIFKETLSSLLGASSPSFSQILGTLKEMERIVKATLQTRQPSVKETALATASSGMPALEAAAKPLSAPPAAPGALPNSLGQKTPSGKLVLQSRDEAYQHLETIAVFLGQNDPHSLAPQLLQQLIRWKNKNVVDILKEIAKTPQEYDMLMRILSSPPSPKE